MNVKESRTSQPVERSQFSQPRERKTGKLALAATIATLLPTVILGAEVGSSNGPVHPSKYSR